MKNYILESNFYKLAGQAEVNPKYETPGESMFILKPGEIEKFFTKMDNYRMWINSPYYDYSTLEAVKSILKGETFISNGQPIEINATIGEVVLTTEFQCVECLPCHTCNYAIITSSAIFQRILKSYLESHPYHNGRQPEPFELQMIAFSTILGNSSWLRRSCLRTSEIAPTLTHLYSRYNRICFKIQRDDFIDYKEKDHRIEQAIDLMIDSEKEQGSYHDYTNRNTALKYRPLSKELIKNDLNKEDKENMNKIIKNITINEGDKIVTVVSDNLKGKTVAMAKCGKDDDFDKYVGVALALVYQKFGSKTAFRKWVDENAKVVAPKERKTRPGGVKAPRPRKEKTSGKEVK